MKDVGQYLLEKYTANEITGEQVLAKLAEHNYCPALLNDDAGRWALVFDGFQNVPVDDEPIDIESCFVVEKHMWKHSVTAAIVNGLKNLEQ